MPTIVAPNNGEVILEVNFANGFPRTTAKPIPLNTAIPDAQSRAGAHNHGTRKNAAANKIKIAFFNIIYFSMIKKRRELSTLVFRFAAFFMRIILI
jgi:hypothetical protein